MNLITNRFLKKRSIVVTLFLLSISLPVTAAHYINKTPFLLKITNETLKQELKYSDNDYDYDESCFIELPFGEEVDFDNEQGDEISITSLASINDKRRLFPTNNYFNYVITYNKYNPKFEKFDINHADVINPK